MKNIRTCIGCRKRREKSEFIRIISLKNEPIIDENMKINSRGIYICKCRNCIDKCLKMLEKGKLNIKINVDKNKLKDVLKNVEMELGE